MNRILYILVFFMMAALTDASAQVDKREVRRGNREFKKENYKEAELEYFRALAKDTLSFAANYNMANTLYRQGSFEQAKKHLDKIKDAAVASPAAADYYYNLGNVAVALKDYQTAVDAYKQSLLRNPGDLEAKENYIYAKEKLKQQQDQQNQSGSEPKISPQAAQQMLQAIQAKEKETQDKVNKAKAAAVKSRQKEKNW